MVNFIYNNKIVNSLLKIETHKLSMLHTGFSSDTKYKISHDVKLKNIFYIATLLGLKQFTLKDAEKFLQTKNFVSESQSLEVQILRNSMNALDFNKSNLADTFSQLDENALLHINRLLLSNWKHSWDARFRNFQENVDETFDTWVNLRDKSLNDEERIQRYKNIINWFVDLKNDYPFWIKFSKWIYESIKLSPFIAANQLTTIIGSDFLLYKKGYSSKLFMSTVELFVQNNFEIIDTYKNCVKMGELFWHEKFLEIVAAYFTNLRESLNKFIAIEENSKKQPFLELNKRQIKVLKYLQSVATIKREDYCHMMEVSSMTAFRDLNDLVNKKLIKVEGKGRATKYRLATM
jgi:hypothetical protein